MDKQKVNLENKILADIKAGRLKLRSKYIFWAEKFGIGGAFVMSLVLAVLFLNLVLFYMRATDNLKYLSFGTHGILAFLESFPYLLVTGLIISILLAGYLITKNDLTYKQPFKYIALILLLFIILAGSVLAYTDIAERIEQQAYGPKPLAPFIKPFFNRGQHFNQHGVAGIIDQINSSNLMIKTPHGLLNVNLTKLKQSQPFEIGQFILAIGEKRELDFMAHQIRIIDQQDLPILQRGIRYHFDNVQKPFNQGQKYLDDYPRQLPPKDCLGEDCPIIR